MRLTILFALAVAACEPDAPSAPPAAECLASEPGLLPQLLSETGFDDPCARAYTPRAWLWSDGALKDRRVFLPDGEVIDDSDVDNWTLPVGAKLWKTFTRDGKKVETRTLWQAEAGVWQGAAYVWNDDESDAVRTTDGVADARGTAHDVPASTTCTQCHGGAMEPIGFAAVMLGHADEPVNVGTLLDEGRLSHTPRSIALPGDALDQQVLSGLHVNCGHCHRDGGDADYLSMRLRMSVNEMSSVEATALFRTAVNQLAENDGALMRIKQGDPDQSFIAIRMAHRGDALQMPPLGTELVDAELLAAVRAWITRLE